MWKTIVRRFLILIPQLLALSLLIFLLAHLMPGDALRGTIPPDAPPAMLQQLRDYHGLNDPWYVQYGRWMRSVLLEWDFGNSVLHNRPVMDIVSGRIMNTVRLSLLTTFFTYLIAIPLGLLAGRKHGRPVDKLIMFYTFVALSMPTIVLAIVNLLIFGFGYDIRIGDFIISTGIFPTQGSVDPRAIAGTIGYFFSRLQHLILPAITLASLSTIGIIYFLRSEIIDYETSDFVLTARSKGVPEKKIYSGHILRNAFLPIAGSMGGIVAGLFGGSIFIETVFSYPGMGELFIGSITSRDFPVVNMLVMFYAVLSVISMLISDILITIIDPRIRIK
ncbi:MAG: ABC transporter permease [Defluviitaleaceae bacterium]|nr:ABC transporter permease [Defluviitaleaceae bacterium]